MWCVCVCVCVSEIVWVISHLIGLMWHSVRCVVCVCDREIVLVVKPFIGFVVQCGVWV